jgi:hypothetical protein
MFEQARHQLHQIAGAVPRIQLETQNIIPAILAGAG